MIPSKFPKALVVEIEGLDGSGKTTGLKYLVEQLTAKGFKVLSTREVGSTHIPVCADLRKIVLNPELTLDGTTMEFIFAAMRIENQKFYKSVEEEYDFIISDRGWLSHLAYTDQNVSNEFTQAFYKGIVAPLTKLPDKILYFDIAPATAFERMQKRGELPDSIEKKGAVFMERVAKSFKSHMMSYGVFSRISHVDANKTLAEVQTELDGHIEALVKARDEKE
jgi:dTMP kinase